VDPAVELGRAPAQHGQRGRQLGLDPAAVVDQAHRRQLGLLLGLPGTPDRRWLQRHVRVAEIFQRDKPGQRLGWKRERLRQHHRPPLLSAIRRSPTAP
jgi:hypothetical protein